MTLKTWTSIQTLPSFSPRHRQLPTQRLFSSDNPLKYILEKHTLGDTVIYDYEVNGIKYSEKVAKYGKIIFPYIAMIADEQRKMAGLISKTYINNPQTLDLLISSLAKQYG